MKIEDIKTLKKLLEELLKKGDYKNYNALRNIILDYEKVANLRNNYNI